MEDSDRVECCESTEIGLVDMARTPFKAPIRLFPIGGMLFFIAAGVVLYASNYRIEQLVFTAIHTDSYQYLCYALQISPLIPAQATFMMEAIPALVGQPSTACFTANGQPVLLLETYYPRLGLSGLLALAAIPQIPVVVLIVPLAIFGFLGWLWGIGVAGIPNLSPPLKIILLILPGLSVPSVLWLSSMMTEGLTTLILVLSIYFVHRSQRSGHHTTFFASVLLIASGALLITRPLWLVSGCLMMLAIMLLIDTHLSLFRSASRLTRYVVQGGLLAGSWAICFILQKVLTISVTPLAKFPVANQPQETLPLRPAELLLVSRVFMDVQWAGIEQAIRIGDFGAPVLLVTTAFSVAILILRKSWSSLLIVGSTWVVSIVTSGIVALCCGGLASYFRYSITSMIVTIFAAMLSLQPRTSSKGTQNEYERSIPTNPQNT